MNSMSSKIANHAASSRDGQASALAKGIHEPWIIRWEALQVAFNEVAVEGASFGDALHIKLI